MNMGRKEGLLRLKAVILIHRPHGEPAQPGAADPLPDTAARRSTLGREDPQDVLGVVRVAREGWYIRGDRFLRRFTEEVRRPLPPIPFPYGPLHATQLTCLLRVVPPGSAKACCSTPPGKRARRCLEVQARHEGRQQPADTGLVPGDQGANFWDFWGMRGSQFLIFLHLNARA